MSIVNLYKFFNWFDWMFWDSLIEILSDLKMQIKQRDKQNTGSDSNYLIILSDLSTSF